MVVSAAQFSLLNGWGNAYPETTGYIIPTLLNYGKKYDDDNAIKTALGFGGMVAKYSK